MSDKPLEANGFEKAIIGVGYRCGKPPIMVYSKYKCIRILTKRGMTWEQAEEYFDYNVQGSWMGEGTPIFVKEAANIQFARSLINEE
jgi:hypothetical protein